MVVVENKTTKETWSFRDIKNAIAFCFCLTRDNDIQTLNNLNNAIIPLGFVAKEF